MLCCLPNPLPNSTRPTACAAFAVFARLGYYSTMKRLVRWTSKRVSTQHRVNPRGLYVCDRVRAGFYATYSMPTADGCVSECERNSSAAAAHLSCTGVIFKAANCSTGPSKLWRLGLCSACS